MRAFFLSSSLWLRGGVFFLGFSWRAAPSMASMALITSVLAMMALASSGLSSCSVPRLLPM